MPTTAVAREEKEIEASIIDAARDLIADGGLPALSMRAVAVRLRLGRRRPSSDRPEVHASVNFRFLGTCAPADKFRMFRRRDISTWRCEGQDLVDRVALRALIDRLLDYHVPERAVDPKPRLLQLEGRARFV